MGLRGYGKIPGDGVEGGRGFVFPIFRFDFPLPFLGVVWVGELVYIKEENKVGGIVTIDPKVWGQL